MLPYIAFIKMSVKTEYTTIELLLFEITVFGYLSLSVSKTINEVLEKYETVVHKIAKKFSIMNVNSRQT